MEAFFYKLYGIDYLVYNNSYSRFDSYKFTLNIILEMGNPIVTKEMQYDYKRLKLSKGDIVSVLSPDGQEMVTVPPKNFSESESVFLFINNRPVMIEKSYIK